MGLFTGMSTDEALAMVVPITVYWLYSGMYEVLGWYWESNRLFSKEKEVKKNVISRWETLRGVLLNQACQIAVMIALFKIQNKGSSAPAVQQQPPLVVQAGQILVAMLVFDAWEYFGHRILHTNKFLYKHLHSKHHLLIVPYAYGTQYQHPLENLLHDTVGGTLAFLISGMTTRTSIFFFTLLTIKFVDDHSTIWLPGNPFHRVFTSNNAFHAVHHQLYGLKFNFSAPFFTFWDKVFGTYMPYTVEEREEGGYELVATKKVD